jgi:hypothetical protein
MIDSITNEAGARGPRASIESRKEKIIIIRRRNRKTVNRNGAAGEIARRSFQNIRATGIGSKAGKFREKMIWIIVKRKGSAKRKGTKGKVKTRFKDGPNRGIKMPDKLVEKEAIRKEATRKNGVVNITAPSGDIIGERHVGFLTRL